MQSLQDKGYEPLARYGFRELVIPLREGLQTKNIYIRLFWFFFLLGCVATGGFAAWSIGSGALTFDAFSGWLLLGIPATFLLVPLHEMVHGLMFRWYGAKDVRYGVIWRYLMFYAVAHLFPVNYQQFRYIALAPFVVISLLCARGVFLGARGREGPHPGTVHLSHDLLCRRFRALRLFLQVPGAATGEL